MKISCRIFTEYESRMLQMLKFAVATLCTLLLTGLPGQTPGPAAAFGQEPAPQAKLQDSYRDKLTKEQQQEIIEKDARIRKLQEGIIDHKIKILGSKKKERTLLDELEAIEKELQDQKKLLVTLHQKSEQQEALLAEKQEYLNEVLAEKRAHQMHVKNRLAAYYRMGSVGLMNVIFSTESLPELLDFKEYFNVMVQHDQTIIEKYLAQIKESNRAREEQAREKLRLMKMAEEVKENEAKLNRIREEKNELLNHVITEQQLYEQAVAEIEEAAADLAATLQKIEAKIRAEPAVPQPTAGTSAPTTGTTQNPMPVLEGFPAHKGLLDPPVFGMVITAFGQTVKGRFDSSSTSNGIDIRVNSGMEIKAIYDGKVIHSGYLRGYGNLMIIDHGQQYFSLIARAADFFKTEGTRVTTGEVIGITGSDDPLYGEGLHFEIRKGSTPEDPLLWLKKNVLPFAAVIQEAQ